jgi:hypothetical protein
MREKRKEKWEKVNLKEKFEISKRQSWSGSVI